MKIWFFSTMMFLAPPLMADGPAAQISSVDPVSGAYLVRIAIGLGLILMIIFLLAWAMKKMHLAPQSSHNLIRIVSAISVGHRDRIALIQVGEEQILVGLTPGRMQKLHEMKSTVQAPDSEKNQSSLFTEKFTQLMQRNRNIPGQGDER